MKTSTLRAVKQRKNTKKIYGFDIETFDENRQFLCANLCDTEGNSYGVFYTKAEVIQALKHPRFRNSIIAATNLLFDFFGTFDGMEEICNFDTLFRGSSLVYAKTYVNDKGFARRRLSKGSDQNYSLWFLDTTNYAQMSVERLGKIIGLPKLEKPEWLGKRPPNSQEEWKILTEYNLRDCEVSAGFIKFLFKAFEDLGATPKITIASTAMNLLKTRYLGDAIYFRQPTAWIEEQFNAYYGGRTECFCRGQAYEMVAYDYNSLYPSIAATAELPDPNFMRVNQINDTQYIMNHEGCALVDIQCPEMKYPLLPFRYEGKTIFPIGTFTGWYTNIELREAQRLGYKILKVHKNYWAAKTCSPLKGYMEDLYKKRLEYQAEKNPMESVIKLLLNGLTGKFGQKFDNKDNWVTGISIDELNAYDNFERFGDFFRVQKTSEPAVFCIPLWIAYITAIGRIKITADAARYDAVYCDTDCIHTANKNVPTSNKLGDFKKEYDIIEAMYVRPKMYGMKTRLSDGSIKETVKIKGLGTRMEYSEFKSKLLRPEVIDHEYTISKEYRKFTKFKEAKRRNLIINEIVTINKHMKLNDEKRDWNEIDYDPYKMIWSTPIQLIDGVPSRVLTQMKKKVIDVFKENVKQDMREFIGSDKFDIHSVGIDISPEEFIENEIFFERNT